MPIPKPTKKDTQKTFMEKCMSKMKGEKRPQRQKVAICLTNWRKKNGKTGK